VVQVFGKEYPREQNVVDTAYLLAINESKRQGDPLSPYLFLICVEGLSSLLSLAESRGDLLGVRVCREAPTISHLLFIDDLLILKNASENNGDTPKRILDVHCSSSGHLVSEAKCSIYFSEITEVQKVVEMCQRLDIITESLNDRCLGLPAMIGADKTTCFFCIWLIKFRR
jgi:hypothetical protein